MIKVLSAAQRPIGLLAGRQAANSVQLLFYTQPSPDVILFDEYNHLRLEYSMQRLNNIILRFNYPLPQCKRGTILERYLHCKSVNVSFSFKHMVSLLVYVVFNINYSARVSRLNGF